MTSTALASVCSAAARDTGADPAGSAAEFTEFLLIPHTAPWSRSAAEDAVDTVLPAALAATIADRPDLRPLAVRPVQGRRTGEQQAPIHGTVGPDGTMARLRPPYTLLGGDTEDSVSGPLFAVCTNGKRDRCCAEIGRPLAVALHAEFGDRVIETSHIGGHRFAGTMLVLPWGYAYGYLDLPAARRVITAALTGLVEPTGLRGRADLPPIEQAAEAYWRQRIGPAAPTAITDLHSADNLVSATVEGTAQQLRLTFVLGPTVGGTACGGKPFTADRWQIEPV